MYIPKLYREEDREKILAFLRENNFAALITYDGERPLATHVPVDVSETDGGGLTISGHIARANPQRQTFDGRDALLIFHGAHAYISPRWYNHVNVPTWDYMIIHVSGKVREIEGEELYAALSRLVQRQEAQTPYRLEGLPQDFVLKQMQGIAGFAVDVTQVEAGYKLSQNRNAEDYENIGRELDKRGDENSKAVAQAMREWRAKPGDR